MTDQEFYREEFIVMLTIDGTSYDEIEVKVTDPNKTMYIKAYMICKAPDGQVLTLYTDMRSGSFNSLSGHEHTWGEWTQTTAPTCTEAGEETRTCSECGEVETRLVEALGHELEYHEAQPAGCATEGSSAYWSCSRCGKYFSDEAGTTEITAPIAIPAKKHIAAAASTFSTL